MGLTLLTGGARSGKSILAVRIASASTHPVVFVATAEPRDEEMADRIEEHRTARPVEWTTVEEPVDLRRALDSAPAPATVVVDCLTLWVSNLLERGAGREEVEERAAAAAASAAGRPGEVLVVTNEVGAGIVPMHPETRRYRDLMGDVNKIFAREAERVLLVVAGHVLPMSTLESVMPDAFRG